MKTAESNCPDCGCELCQCPDHIEDVRGMVPEVFGKHDTIFLKIGNQSFALAFKPEDEPEMSAGQQAEWYMDQLRGALSNITHGLKADCPRCAELADQLQFQSSLTKELLPYQDEAVQSRAKLAALEAKCMELLASGRSLSDAYIRLRTKLNAFRTPTAPTPEQVWKHTEDCLDSLLEKLAALEAENARLKTDLSNCDGELMHYKTDVAQQAERLKELETIRGNGVLVPGPELKKMQEHLAAVEAENKRLKARLHFQKCLMELP